MMGRIKTCMQAFYNNQFKRDAGLLNIMEEKEIEMENNMLRKIDGFKHIYKELFKEFERIMKEIVSSWMIMMSMEGKHGWKVWI